MSTINSEYGGTITAFFDSRSEAEDASRRLIEAGIPQASVRLVPGYENDEAVADTSTAHRGFFDALADFFMPDQDRYSYAEGLSRGGFLITVSNVPTALHETAIDILDDEGAVDLDEREEGWRSEGWSGYNADYSTTDASTGLSTAATAGLGIAGSASTVSTTTTAAATGLGLGTDEVIPVVQEELRIGKRDVNLGRVRVRSYVMEEPVSEQVNLREDRVQVERRPVDRPLTAGDAAFTDRTIEAEEHAEQAVVAKEARVTEEISLRKDSTERQETVTDTVRHTEVEVEDDRDLTTRGTGTVDRR